jgi:hypothetical protein
MLHGVSGHRHDPYVDPEIDSGIDSKDQGFPS